MLTGDPIELWPLADLVIAIPDGVRCADKEGFQPGFTINQRNAGEVFAIQEQEIEDEVDKRGVAVFEGILNQVERRATIRKDAAEFSIEVGAFRG